MFPFLEDAGDGYWTLPAHLPEIPLMFSLKARKKRRQEIGDGIY